MQFPCIWRFGGHSPGLFSTRASPLRQFLIGYNQNQKLNRNRNQNPKLETGTRNQNQKLKLDTGYGIGAIFFSFPVKLENDISVHLRFCWAFSWPIQYSAIGLSYQEIFTYCMAKTSFQYWFSRTVLVLVPKTRFQYDALVGILLSCSSLGAPSLRQFSLLCHWNILVSVTVPKLCFPKKIFDLNITLPYNRWIHQRCCQSKEIWHNFWWQHRRNVHVEACFFQPQKLT